MHRYLTLGMGLVAGAVLGAAAVLGSEAQAKPYSIAEIERGHDLYTARPRIAGCGSRLFATQLRNCLHRLQSTPSSNGHTLERLLTSPER